MSYPDLTPEQLRAREAKAERKARKRAERNVDRAKRRGRITQTKETCAPAEKLLKRALGPHVTAPGFHHDPRVMQARSMAAVERQKALAEIRGAR